MRNWIIIALLGLSAQATQAGEITTAEKPPDVSPRIKGLIGDYKRGTGGTGGTETLVVLERGGHLLIREAERERPYTKPAGYTREKMAATLQDDQRFSATFVIADQPFDA